MQCISPINLKKETGNWVTVPCGKCTACLSRLRDTWSFRLKQELKKSSSAHFITLTYSDENEPKTKMGLGTLNKSDIQKFMKRLRIRIARAQKTIETEQKGFNHTIPSELNKVSQIARKGPKIKYYIVGEYGTKTHRPHYHGIFFNLPLNGEELDRFIRETWQKGHVLIGTVNDASIHYTTKYCITKKVELNEREKPFSLISTKPPIGNDYVKDNRKFHIRNNAFYCVGPDGIKSPMPRFYKDKIFTKLKQEVHKKEITKVFDKKFSDKIEESRLLNDNYFKRELESTDQWIKNMKNKIYKNEKL